MLIDETKGLTLSVCINMRLPDKLLAISNYSDISLFTERSSSSESQQIDINQDPASLLLLFASILQARYYSRQCSKSR